MASVSSVNPGLSDLLQNLANLDSPVVSSPAAVAALEKAPPADIVQLSEAAMQLEGLDEMFGIQNGGQSDSGATSLENLLNAAVGASVTSPGAAISLPGPAAASSGAATTGAATAPASSTTSSTPSSTTSLANQLSNYQLASQTSEVQTLFDPGATGGPSDSLLSLIA
jgi:hypothetical protein